MSALTRYPVPQAVASGAVAGPQLYFILEPGTPLILLPILSPVQGKEAVPSGAVDKPRLYFRLTPAPDLLFSSLTRSPVPQPALPGAVDNPRLYFRLEQQDLGSAKRQRQLSSFVRTTVKRRKARRRC